MEITNSQENSNTDFSPTTPPAQEYSQIDPEVSIYPVVDKPEAVGPSTTTTEAEASAQQHVLDSPILDQVAVSSLVHEEGLQGRGESIGEETLGEASPQSADTSKEVLSAVTQQPEKDGDSTLLPGVPIEDGMISEASNAMGGPCKDELLAVSNEPSGNQEEVVNKSNKAPEPVKPPDHVKQVDAYRALVDTTAPFESVREAVTKFGGIVDWKAHKILTVERRKNMELELKRAKEEIPEYKKQSEAAEDAKEQVLQELYSTRRFIEELKLLLERAKTEEEQAKQDCELAQLRVEEMEQGIADEASVAAKAQMDVAKGRHATAVSELKSVKDELEKLRSGYASLIKERDMAVRKAEEAETASKEIEKKVGELAIELRAAKESLESARATHLEAEGQRIAAAMAGEEEILNWEKEKQQTDEEIEKLNEHLFSSNDLKSKLESASTLMLNLKAELAAYVEAKLDEEINGEVEEKLRAELEEARISQSDTVAVIESTKKELEEVRVSIEKAKEDVKCLRVAALSLNSELEGEKSALAATIQREGMASIAVASLEAELSRITSEMELVQTREKQVKDKLEVLPGELQQAALEADQAKSEAQLAHDELRRVREEAEQAKAGASTIESRLHAAIKEIEAAKASERLALAAIKALQESESAHEDTPAGVTLRLEEYYALSKRAHEAEELANVRVAAAMSQIQVAKEAESRSLEQLEEANREVIARMEALRVTREKAERAKEGKLGVEQELRKWRAEHEQQRKKSIDSAAAAAAAEGQHSPVSQSPRRSVDEKKVLRGSGGEQGAAAVPLVAPLPSSKVFISGNNMEDMVMPEKKNTKKKKSLFPRIVMFLARKEQ